MTAKAVAVALIALGALASLPAAAGTGFDAVFTADGVDVWAVGDAGAVYRSLDAGANWGSYPLGSSRHRGVAARGARVWIVDEDGTLWTSTNTGYSFSSSAPAGDVALRAICFADESAGWIVGAGGTILRTADAGATWSPEVSGTTADLDAVRFRDASEGWACGAAGTLLHTTDGGASWLPAAPPGAARDLNDVDFDGPAVWVAGDYGFCARSLDAGASWQQVDLRLWSRSDVHGVAMAPGGALWLCGGGGFLRRTTDAGRTWFFPKHRVMSGMSDVFFIDDRRGWACAARSKLVARTTDGGETWTLPGGGDFTYSWGMKLSSGPDIVRGNTLVIDPVRREKIYCVQGRRVYASWDVGERWTNIATIAGAGSRTNAFLVSPTDTNTWLALVQDGDRITRTTDGGATWTPVISKPFTEYGLPMEQDPNDPNVVYFAPEDGRFYRSADFGATWVEVSIPRFRSPDDITAVKDAAGVMYVSDGVTGSGLGQVWKTSDGGLTWTLKKSVSGSEIPTISVSWHDPWIAYATAWSSGGVLHTSDMGENWPSVATTAAAWGTDIAKDDPYVSMFAVYSGATTYLTTDDGARWRTAALPGSNYAVLAWDRATYICHQSSGTYKATINQPDMPASNAQTVAVIVPNGGEVWAYGELDTVRWTAANLATVKLEYRLDPLAPWAPIAPAASGTAHLFPWPVPGTPGAQATVRVSDANDGAPEDTSDATFRIVVPAIECSRSRLDFARVWMGQSRIDTLVLRNTGTSTLVISSVSVPGGGPFTPTRTSFSVPVGGEDSVFVVFEPSAMQAYSDTLVIACNAPGPPTRVPLSGTGVAAVIQCDRDRIDFLRVLMGRSKTDTLIVRNTGTSTLVVSSVAVPGGGPFTPARTSFSIPGGAEDTVLVRFEPAAAQLYADTLVIASNALSSPSRIPLSGDGREGDALSPWEERAGALVFALYGFAPNPFGGGGTVIGYSLAEEGDVDLRVYNVLGQEVSALVRRRQPPGHYAIRFPGAAQIYGGSLAGMLPSGVYFCRLRAGSHVATKQMVLIR